MSRRPGPPRCSPRRAAGLAALAVLAACAGPARLAEPLPPVAARRAEPRPAALSPARAERLASLGQYRAALQEYGTLRARDPSDATILASQRRTVVAIKDAADADSSRGELAAAGRGYRLLIDAFPGFGALAASLPFDPPALRRALEGCAVQLTSAGLERYRRSELDGAIARWQAVLTFDPGNAAVRKAIDDARAQQEALQGLDATTTRRSSSSSDR